MTPQEYEKWLGGYNERVEEAVKEGQAEACAVIEDEARLLTPVQTGHLRDSWSHTDTQVTNDASYAPIVIPNIFDEIPVQKITEDKVREAVGRVK